MAILKSQNSRIKNTVKEMQNGELKKSKVEVTEVYQEEKKKIINNPTNQQNVSISTI